MFIRIDKVKGKEYYRLVETYRENGKVKQRTLRQLGPAGLYGDDPLYEYGLPSVLADALEDMAEHPEAYGNKKQRAKSFKEMAEGLLEAALARQTNDRPKVGVGGTNE